MTGLAVPQDPIPAFLLTGFLGSGKTTLLKNILARPEWARTAVIVNELGDVGLDHLLLERSDEETLLLEGGCLCCALKSDLVLTLQSLLMRGERGELPMFERIVIETTGLADPGALIRTFWSDPLRLSRYRFAGTVTCVDAVTGEGAMARYAEARRQIAFADVLLVTKTDLGPSERMRAAARAINPGVPLYAIVQGRAPARALRSVTAAKRSVNAKTHGDASHASDVVTASATSEAILAWRALEAGLADLTASYGEHLLRLKGIVRAAEFDVPIRIDAVQGLFHRPLPVSQKRHAVEGSCLVAIAQSVDQGGLQRNLISLLDRSAAKEFERGRGEAVGLDPARSCRQMRGNQ